MKVLRVYIDTSVIGGCFEPEFSDASNLLIEQIIQGRVEMVLSELTILELELAPARVKGIVDKIPEGHVDMIEITSDMKTLAGEYRKSNVIGPATLNDGLHVAAATVSGSDVIASWNFRHLTNIRKVREYNAVNMRLGYKTIDIRSPKEIVYEKE